MQAVPIQPVPSQTFSVILGNQNCTLNIYQKATGLFVDVLVAGVLVIGGVIAENLNRIVRGAYLGFMGDLAFFDTQGKSDPAYAGLGSRFVLLYLTPADLAAVGLVG